MWHETFKTRHLFKKTQNRDQQKPVIKYLSEGISVLKCKMRTNSHTSIVETTKNSTSTVSLLFLSIFIVHSGHPLLFLLLLFRYQDVIFEQIFYSGFMLLAEAVSRNIMQLFCLWSRVPGISWLSRRFVRPLNELFQLPSAAPTNTANQLF